MGTGRFPPAKVPAHGLSRAAARTPVRAAAAQHVAGPGPAPDLRRAALLGHGLRHVLGGMVPAPEAPPAEAPAAIQRSFWYRHTPTSPVLFYAGYEKPKPYWTYDEDVEHGRRVYYPLGKDAEDKERTLKAVDVERQRAALLELEHEGRSIGQIFTKQAESLGIIPPGALADIDVQPDKDTKIHPVDIVFSFCIESAGVEASGLSQEFLEQTLFQPEVWSACYNTAAILFELLGTKKSRYASDKVDALKPPDGVEAAAEQKLERQGKMSAAMEGLLADMAVAAGTNQPRIYNCGFGIHGFALIVRHGRVELLQSFANGLHYKLPAITIAESIQVNKVKSVDEMTDLLSSMASDDIEIRLQSEDALFATRIEPDPPFPWCQFYWEGDNLQPLPDLIETMRARLTTNFKTLQALHSKVGKKKKRIKEAKALIEAAEI